MKRLLWYILPAVAAVPALLLTRVLKAPVGRRHRASAHRPRTTMVYVTDFGTKYHTADCRALLHSRTAHKVALDEIAGQYDACSECHPPVPSDTADR